MGKGESLWERGGELNDELQSWYLPLYWMQQAEREQARCEGRLAPFAQALVQAADTIRASAREILPGCTSGDLRMLVCYWASLGYLSIFVNEKGHVVLRRRVEMGNERRRLEVKLFALLFGADDVTDGASLRYKRTAQKAQAVIPRYWSRRIYAKSSGNPLVMQALCVLASAFAALVTMTGNECADLTTAGGKLEPGMTKLAGHKEFAVSSVPELLGRTVDVYVKNGKVVGLPCALVSEVCHTFSSVQEMKKTLSDAGYQMTADTQYYLNFDPADAGVLEKLPEHAARVPRPDARPVRLPERIPHRHPRRGHHVAQDLEQQAHIGNIGNIFNPAGAVHQQRRGQNGDGGIFGAGNGDGAVELFAASDQIFNQSKSLFGKSISAIAVLNSAKRHHQENSTARRRCKEKLTIQKQKNS